MCPNQDFYTRLSICSFFHFWLCVLCHPLALSSRQARIDENIAKRPSVAYAPRASYLRYGQISSAPPMSGQVSLPSIALGVRVSLRIVVFSQLVALPCQTALPMVCASLFRVETSLQPGSDVTGAGLNMPVIAQLAEHLTVDLRRHQMVPGSIPGDRNSDGLQTYEEAPLSLALSLSLMLDLLDSEILAKAKLCSRSAAEETSRSFQAQSSARGTSEAHLPSPRLRGRERGRELRESSKRAQES